jgi:hypothetical protein
MDNTARGENVTKNSGFQVPSSLRPTRERVGLIVDGTNAAAAVKTIAAAEAAGVRQIWMVQSPWSPDILTTFAAATTKTSSVLRNVHCANLSTPSTRSGTAISGAI